MRVRLTCKIRSQLSHHPNTVRFPCQQLRITRYTPLPSQLLCAQMGRSRWPPIQLSCPQLRITRYTPLSGQSAGRLAVVVNHACRDKRSPFCNPRECHAKHTSSASFLLESKPAVSEISETSASWATLGFLLCHLLWCQLWPWA